MPPVLCNMERAHIHKLHVVGKINIEKSKARAWSSRRRSTPETAANWNKKRREGGLNKRILRRAIEEEKLDIYCLMERESTQVTRVAHTFPFFFLPCPPPLCWWALLFFFFFFPPLGRKKADNPLFLFYVSLYRAKKVFGNGRRCWWNLRWLNHLIRRNYLPASIG